MHLLVPDLDYSIRIVPGEETANKSDTSFERKAAAAVLDRTGSRRHPSVAVPQVSELSSRKDRNPQFEEV